MESETEPKISKKIFRQIIVGILAETEKLSYEQCSNKAKEIIETAEKYNVFNPQIKE